MDMNSAAAVTPVTVSDSDSIFIVSQYPSPVDYTLTPYILQPSEGVIGQPAYSYIQQPIPQPLPPITATRRSYEFECTPVCNRCTLCTRQFGSSSSGSCSRSCNACGSCRVSGPHITATGERIYGDEDQCAPSCRRCASCSRLSAISGRIDENCPHYCFSCRHCECYRGSLGHPPRNIHPELCNRPGHIRHYDHGDYKGVGEGIAPPPLSPAQEAASECDAKCFTCAGCERVSGYRRMLRLGTTANCQSACEKCNSCRYELRTGGLTRDGETSQLQALMQQPISIAAVTLSAMDDGEPEDESMSEMHSTFAVAQLPTEVYPAPTHTAYAGGFVDRRTFDRCGFTCSGCGLCNRQFGGGNCNRICSTCIRCRENDSHMVRLRDEGGIEALPSYAYARFPLSYPTQPVPPLHTRPEQPVRIEPSAVVATCTPSCRRCLLCRQTPKENRYADCDPLCGQCARCLKPLTESEQVQREHSTE